MKVICVIKVELMKKNQEARSLRNRKDTEDKKKLPKGKDFNHSVSTKYPMRKRGRKN
jgi:hypothetical protein